MSWGLDEFAQEQSIDSTSFTTPAGHQGGDFCGRFGRLWVAGVFSGLLAERPGDRRHHAQHQRRAIRTRARLPWSGSGGGTSLYESEPVYQDAVQSTAISGQLFDVAWDADPQYRRGGLRFLGRYRQQRTVAGGSVARAWRPPSVVRSDRDRKPGRRASHEGRPSTRPLSDLAGGGSLSLPASDFHDITKGSNGGFKAGPGYDEVTGLGTPKANLLAVPGLVAYGTATPDRRYPTSRQRASSPGTPSGLWSQPRTPRGRGRGIQRHRHHLLGDPADRAPL